VGATLGLERREGVGGKVGGCGALAGFAIEALAAAGSNQDGQKHGQESDCGRGATHGPPVIGSRLLAMIPSMEIRDRVALVTGGGGAGTGRAIALRLARARAAVVVADVDEEGGRETVRQIEAEGGRTAFVRADVTVEADVRAMIRVAEETFGGLDILVNSAGGTPQPHFPEAPLEHWSRYLDLNLRGPMVAIHHAMKAFSRRGGGAVVNIASIAGLGYGPHSSPEYSAAKAGLIRLTATLAPLAERANVQVNCIVPNWIGTEEVKAEIAAMTPEERAEVPTELTPPEEIAEAVARFLEDDSAAGRVLVWWTGEPPRLVPVERRDWR
jgi:NAD(P)-dependent dehydrogenase (short-subunit alcohol dehydrogenase family)